MANLRMAHCYAAILMLEADFEVAILLEASLASAMEYLAGEPEQAAAAALMAEAGL